MEYLLEVVRPLAHEYRGSGPKFDSQGNRCIKMFDFGLNKRKDEGKNPHYLLGLSHSQGKIMLNHQSDQSNCQLLWKGKR